MSVRSKVYNGWTLEIPNAVDGRLRYRWCVVDHPALGAVVKRLGFNETAGKIYSSYNEALRVAKEIILSKARFLEDRARDLDRTICVHREFS